MGIKPITAMIPKRINRITTRGGGAFLTVVTSLVTTVVVTIGVARSASHFQKPERGQVQVSAGRVPIPVDGRDLLENPPFDRLTLIDGTQILIEPISPRPLPDPEVERKKKAKAATEKGKGVFGKLPDTKREDDRASMIAIHTVPPDVGDYLVKPTSIQSVDYYEDFLLDEAERRARRGDFERAFEHLLAVESRDPNWPGLVDTADKLIFLEGQAAVMANDVDRGIRLLGELYLQKPEFSGLAEALGSAYAGRIGAAFEGGDYALGRRELRSLAKLAPDHPEVTRSRTQFLQRAERIATAAEGLGGADATEGLAEALAIWPNDAAIAARFEAAFQVAPVLDVAVEDVPRGLGPWLLSSADHRVSRLVYLPILADASEEAALGEPTDQLAAELTSGDLGRRITLRVRTSRSWNDRSRPVGAVDLSRTLTDRALPSSPAYEARWADLVDQVAILAVDEVELKLNRAPLDIETLLLGPMGPAHAGYDGRVWTPEGTRLLGTGLFEPVQESDPHARFDRVDGSSDGGGAIARIRERRYDDPDDSVAALLGGEVTLLESVPPRSLTELRANSSIRIGRYAQPELHWIALDGRNPVLRNRSLRRALAVAVDRSTLLEETILRSPIEGENALTDGPVPKGNYADSTSVEPIPYDLLLARMLVAAARKELGGEPIKLTFSYPSVAVARVIVPKLVETYRLIGLEVEMAEEALSALEGRLRAGDRFDLAYRYGAVEEPVRDLGPILCPGYDAPTEANGLGALVSPRMLQLLLQLDQAQDWPTARGVVAVIDREARDELPIVPLWQLERHYAWRDRLVGPSESTTELYQGIASWRLDPWFARDAE